MHYLLEGTVPAQQGIVGGTGRRLASNASRQDGQRSLDSGIPCGRAVVSWPYSSRLEQVSIRGTHAGKGLRCTVGCQPRELGLYPSSPDQRIPTPFPSRCHQPQTIQTRQVGQRNAPIAPADLVGIWHNTASTVYNRFPILGCGASARCAVSGQPGPRRRGSGIASTTGTVVDPSRESLGTLLRRCATAVPQHPPAAIGFLEDATCRRATYPVMLSPQGQIDPQEVPRCGTEMLRGCESVKQY